MPSTTLKLSAELKKRIAPLARAAGKSPHAWMVETLEEAAQRAELRLDFIEEALEAAAEIDAGGPLYAAEDVHEYFLGRLAGRKVKRPTPIRR
jgi:predicted transcriptional regulator